MCQAQASWKRGMVTEGVLGREVGNRKRRIPSGALIKFGPHFEALLVDGAEFVGAEADWIIHSYELHGAVGFLQGCVTAVWQTWSIEASIGVGCWQFQPLACLLPWLGLCSGLSSPFGGNIRF